MAGDAVASRDCGRLRLVGWAPGNHRSRVGEDGAGGFGRQERRDQGGAVGDEYVPADGAVVAADLLDRVEVEPRRQFIAIDGAGQQHAAQARGMDLRQEGLGDALRALDFVGGGSDGGAEFARAGNGVGGGWGHEVHVVACQDIWRRLERVRGWGEIAGGRCWGVGGRGDSGRPPACESAGQNSGTPSPTLPRFAGEGG